MLENSFHLKPNGEKDESYYQNSGMEKTFPTKAVIIGLEK